MHYANMYIDTFIYTHPCISNIHVQTHPNMKTCKYNSRYILCRVGTNGKYIREREIAPSLSYPPIGPKSTHPD